MKCLRRTPQKNLFWVYKIDIKNNVVSQPGRNGNANSITTGNSAYDIAISIPEELLPVKTLSRKMLETQKKQINHLKSTTDNTTSMMQMILRTICFMIFPLQLK